MEQNDTKVFKVINGNSYELLKDFPDNYFDAIVTDPPYGLGKEPDANETLKAWIETGYIEVKGSGFMGKEWDAFVPQPIFWKEVFRVLKHGGHVLAFYGTRTYDWGVMAMRLAGFEVRDCIQWLYGSGFPKSHNISKAIEGKILNGSSNPRDFKKLEGQKSITKLGTFNNIEKTQGKRENDVTGRETTINHKISTEEAKQWDGWGSALKPANEPIVLARKPLEKGLSIAENVLKWGTGAINIDGCRVGNDLIKGQKAGQGFNNVKGFGVNTKMGNEEAKEYISQDLNGRFPANLILTHHEDCVCKGTKKVKGNKDGIRKASSEFGQNSGWNDHENKDTIRKGTADSDGNETIENWDCHEDCPIRLLDEQSGELKSGDIKPYKQKNTDSYSGSMPTIRDANFKGDKGGASRFFYVAKASKSERNKGLDGFEVKRPDIRTEKGMGTFEEKGVAKQSNFHPTVKPIKLMQYLVRLITPPNGIVLDPFCGSGTTGIACKLEGFEFVGIEQDAEYCKIADARIKNYTEEKQNSLKIKIDDTQLDLF